MSYDYHKALNDNSLFKEEKLKADLKEKELNEVSERVDQQKIAIIAANDLFAHPIPTHVWRPAWSTSQIVSLINILYTQKKILSKTVEKICNKWDDSRDFIHDNIQMQLDQKMYRPHLETTYKKFEDPNTPRIKDMQSWLEKEDVMQFPFKDRVNERKRQRGIK